MSLSYGIFISFISVLNDCLEVLEFKESGKVTSIVIGFAMAVGAMFALFSTFAVRFTHKYKRIISACNFVPMQACWGDF